MSEIQTYKNWKAVTEADFVSLFIKTWFAYISTLRVMFPEAQNTRGDGKYLYAYNKFYLQEGRKKFIVGMFLEALAEEQDEDYHSLVRQRWNAIGNRYR